VLLSRLVGLEAVALYELALRVVGQVGGLFLSVATALFPAAAAARAGEPAAGGALVPLYRAAARYVAWLALPAYGLLVALAPAFVGAWLGPGYGQAALAMRLLAAGWLVAILATPAFLVAQAGGAERLSTNASFVTAGVSVFAAAALVPSAGLGGVALGGSLGLAAGGLAILAAFGRRFGLSVPDLLPWGARAPLAAAVSAGLAAALVRAAPPSLGGVVVAAAAGLAAYAGLLAVTGAVRPADRALLGALLTRAAG